MNDTGSELIRKCAWCNKNMDIGAAMRSFTGNQSVTHGICFDCVTSLLSENQATKLNEYLNKFEFPVIAVDKEGRVLTANNPLFKRIVKEAKDVEGELAGFALECKNSRLPEGCGKTEHCTACAIRNSLEYTYKTGEALNEVKAFMEMITPKGYEKIDIIISTEKVGEKVLLKIVH